MTVGFWTTRLPMTTELARINRVCRYALAFVFAFHGLVPKILWLSPIEVAWVNAHHLPLPPALFAAVAGVFEIAIALAIAMRPRVLWPVGVAGALLLALLADAMLFAPGLFVQAFNPATTNIAALALCYAIYASQPAIRSPTR